MMPLEPRNTAAHIRMSPGELELIHRAASVSARSINNWARLVLVREAELTLQKYKTAHGNLKDLR